MKKDGIQTRNRKISSKLKKAAKDHRFDANFGFFPRPPWPGAALPGAGGLGGLGNPFASALHQYNPMHHFGAHNPAANLSPFSSNNFGYNPVTSMAHTLGASSMFPGATGSTLGGAYPPIQPGLGGVGDPLANPLGGLGAGQMQLGGNLGQNSGIAPPQALISDLGQQQQQQVQNPQNQQLPQPGSYGNQQQPPPEGGDNNGNPPQWQTA